MDAALPAWGQVVGLILRPKGSSAGVDGLPHEVYQVAPRGLACLVGQAARAATLGAWAVRRVMGREPDLLVWTPKPTAKLVEARAAEEGGVAAPGSYRGLPPGGARPLMVPTCKMRILGALWAGRVGPALEPELSPHQAAKHGGGCGANISRAFEHLDPAVPGGGEAGDIADKLWVATLGAAAGPVQQICAEAADPRIGGCPIAARGPGAGL